MVLDTVGLIIIKDRKLLLAFSKNKNCFYLPGGKVDNGETPATALCREIREELNIDLHPDTITYYTHVSADAFGEVAGTIMEQDCYFPAHDCEPEASAEIGEVRFFSKAEYLKERYIAPGVVIIMDKLRNDNFID